MLAKTILIIEPQAQISLTPFSYNFDEITAYLCYSKRETKPNAEKLYRDKVSEHFLRELSFLR